MRFTMSKYDRLPEEILLDIGQAKDSARNTDVGVYGQHFPCGAGDGSPRYAEKFVGQAVKSAKIQMDLENELERALTKERVFGTDGCAKAAKLLAAVEEVLRSGMHNGQKIDAEKKARLQFEREKQRQIVRGSSKYIAWADARKLLKDIDKNTR